eukprot:scaffold41249_cov58-Phaeocystis_antarctica.AAC.3
MVFRHRARAQHRGQGKSDQHAKSDKKRTSFTVRIECWPQLSVGTIVVDGLVTIEMVSSLIPLLKYGANATAYGLRRRHWYTEQTLRPRLHVLGAKRPAMLVSEHGGGQSSPSVTPHSTGSSWPSHTLLFFNLHAHMGARQQSRALPRRARLLQSE